MPRVETMVTARGPIGASQKSEDAMRLARALLGGVKDDGAECVAKTEAGKWRRYG